MRRDSPAAGDDLLAIKVVLVEILQELARTHPDPGGFLAQTRQRVLAAAMRVAGPQLVTAWESRCSAAITEVFASAESQVEGRGPNEPPLSVEQLTESLRQLLPRD
jgi:hypothetical protein